MGIAGIVAGSIFGIRTFVKKADGDKECDPPDGYYCSQAGLDAHSAARTSATLSTVGFAVGLTGAGAAVALFLLSMPKTPAAKNARNTKSVWAAPSFSKDGAFVGAGGVF